jgi:hypothetical protein
VANWKDADRKRYLDERVYERFTKRDGATCLDLGGLGPGPGRLGRRALLRGAAGLAGLVVGSYLLLLLGYYLGLLLRGALDPRLHVHLGALALFRGPLLPFPAILLYCYCYPGLGPYDDGPYNFRGDDDDGGGHLLHLLGAFLVLFLVVVLLVLVLPVVLFMVLLLLLLLLVILLILVIFFVLIVIIMLMLIMLLVLLVIILVLVLLLVIVFVRTMVTVFDNCVLYETLRVV